MYLENQELDVLFTFLIWVNESKLVKSKCELSKCKQSMQFDKFFFNNIKNVLKMQNWRNFSYFFQMSKTGYKRRLLLTGSIHTYLG